MIKRTLFFLLILGWIYPASAQKIAVKTNLLQWATTTPNLGAEVALSRRTTVELSWAYNPWTFSDNRKLQHWKLQPEFRFWFWEPFNGHFLGLNAVYSEFNAGGIKLLPKLADYRYEGKLYGGGLTYGYQWMLSNRWVLEASLGAGYQHIRYHQYQCRTCGLPTGADGKPLGESPLQTKRYFGVTKAAVSLIYIIH